MNAYALNPESIDRAALNGQRVGSPRWLREVTEVSEDQAVLREFELHMRIARRSEITIKRRMELLARLVIFLAGVRLLDVDSDHLEAFQATFQHLAPASANIYTRHMRAFYCWALKARRIDDDPASRIPIPAVRKGLPHPTTDDQLRTIFDCATGRLRLAYVLAAFAGLRCGEITRLRSEHIELNSPEPTAWIQGKAGRERRIPILLPVVEELRSFGRRGWLMAVDGSAPWTPNGLSVQSHDFLKEIGVETTLHSLRHSFGTRAARLTRDPLLVRDLLGHASVATTEIYMLTTLDGAHNRLEAFGAAADNIIVRRLRVVR
jgi:integrase